VVQKVRTGHFLTLTSSNLNRFLNFLLSLAECVMWFAFGNFFKQWNCGAIILNLRWHLSTRRKNLANRLRSDKEAKTRPVLTFWTTLFIYFTTSVRILQVNFGTLDFKHLYNVQRWKFIHTTKNSCAYRSGFVELLDAQFRGAAYIVESYGA